MCFDIWALKKIAVAAFYLVTTGQPGTTAPTLAAGWPPMPRCGIIVSCAATVGSKTIAAAPRIEPLAPPTRRAVFFSPPLPDQQVRCRR